MSNLPGETPQHSLTPDQMEVLEGFIIAHKAFSNITPEITQYYDQASAFMRDALLEQYNVAGMNIDEYYATMAGLSMGTSMTERSCTEGGVNLKDAADSMEYLTNLFDSVPPLNPVESQLEENGKLLLDYLLAALERFGLNPDDTNKSAAVSRGLKIGTYWTAGIANTKFLTVSQAAEIVTITFARLSPLQFDI
jgi:hypothetical protein